MWMLLKQILPPLVAAVALEGGLFAAARFFPPDRRGGGLLPAIAVGLGYAAGHAVAAGGWPVFPPLDAIDWLFYAALAGLLPGIFASPSSHALARSGAFAVLGGGFLLSLAWPKFQHAWAPLQGIAWMTALLLALLLLRSSLERLARERNPIRGYFPLLLVIPAGGTCVALMVSGSLFLGELAMILTATIGIAWLAQWRMAIPASNEALVPLLSLLLAGLWISGWFYADLPPLCALLLLLAPAAAALPINRDLFPIKWLPWFRAAAMALLVTIAVGLAIHASVPMEGAMEKEPIP